MNRSFFRLGICESFALIAFAGGPPVYAQGGATATLSGTVTDPSGAVLPGVTISAKHLATGVVTTSVTNSQGAFTMAGMAVGVYEISSSLEGFKTAVIKSLNLTSAQPTDVKLTLEVGGVSELVTVASTSEIIHTQSTTISSTINTNQITKLPLTSRSAMDFVNFLPACRHRWQPRRHYQRAATGRHQYHAGRHQHPGQHVAIHGRIFRDRQPASRRD